VLRQVSSATPETTFPPLISVRSGMEISRLVQATGGQDPKRMPVSMRGDITAYLRRPYGSAAAVISSKGAARGLFPIDADQNRA
jgi:hypothetical protein